VFGLSTQNLKTLGKSKQKSRKSKQKMSILFLFLFGFHCFLLGFPGFCLDFLDILITSVFHTFTLDSLFNKAEEKLRAVITVRGRQIVCDVQLMHDIAQRYGLVITQHKVVTAHVGAVVVGDGDCDRGRDSGGIGLDEATTV
jgi:hypothetical protein